MTSNLGDWAVGRWLLPLPDAMDSAPDDIPDWSAAEDNDKRVCARSLGPAPIPPACNDCRCPLAAKVSYLAALPIGSHALHLPRGPLEPALCSGMLCLLCVLLVNCKQLWKGPDLWPLCWVLVYFVQTARDGTPAPEEAQAQL